MVNWWNGSVAKDIDTSIVDQHCFTHFSMLVILWLCIKRYANTYYLCWHEMKAYWTEIHSSFFFFLKSLFSKSFFIQVFLHGHSRIGEHRELIRTISFFFPILLMKIKLYVTSHMTNLNKRNEPIAKYWRK